MPLVAVLVMLAVSFAVLPLTVSALAMLGVPSFAVSLQLGQLLVVLRHRRRMVADRDVMNHAGRLQPPQ